MHGMTVDQALNGLDIGGIAHLLGVFEIGLERTAENAAERVDFLAGQRQAVLEFDAIGGGEIGERRCLADRNRIAGSARTVIDGGEHGGTAAEGRGPFEKIATAWNDVRGRKCLVHLSLPVVLRIGVVVLSLRNVCDELGRSVDGLCLMRLQRLLAPVQDMRTPRIFNAGSDSRHFLHTARPQ